MTGTRLTEDQRLDWLRLIRSENIGPRTFRALVNQFGGAARALEALPEIVRRRGRAVLKVTARADAEREMERASRPGVRFVALGEPDYPRTLQAIETAPPLIAVRGSAEWTDSRARPASNCGCVGGLRRGRSTMVADVRAGGRCCSADANLRDRGEPLAMSFPEVG